MAKKVMTVAERKERWFAPGKKLNWRKDEKQSTRIRKTLASRDGNILAAARALNALANVTKDATTRRLARSDAQKLFARYKKQKKR